MRSKIMKTNIYTTNGCWQWACRQVVVDPVPSSPASEFFFVEHDGFTGVKKCKCKQYHGTKAIFFFSSRLFDRRMSSSNDCFTGPSPGIRHDGSHLYTGGPRMCIGEGQVQAGLLRRGLGVCCRGGGGDFSEDLTDGCPQNPPAILPPNHELFYEFSLASPTLKFM